MKKDIRRHVLSIILVSTFLVLVTTFVYMPNRSSLVSALSFLTGEQAFYMEDVSSGLLLKDSIPLKDSDGMKIEPYTFRIVNNTNHNITYKIIFNNNSAKAEEAGMEVLDNHYLRYLISDSTDTSIEVNTLADDGVLATFTITPKSNQVFNFRMWLDYDCDSDAMGKIFIGSLKVEEIK